MAKKKRNQKLIILRVQMLLTIFSLAVSLTTFSYLTYAWFTSNRQVFIENHNTTVGEQFKYTTQVKADGVFVTDPEVSFINFFPGNINSRTLTFILTSLDEKDFNVRWFFAAPNTSDEVPYIERDAISNEPLAYYYLGSQIQTRIITLPSGSSANPVGEGNYLVETASTGLLKGQDNSVPNAITSFSAFNIVTDLLIPSMTTVTVDITLTFVDNGTDQSVYAENGAEITSKRTLALFTTPA